MSSFEPVVPIAYHGLVSGVCLIVGAILTARFSLTSGLEQILFILPASLLLALGAMYGLMAAGVSLTELSGRAAWLTTAGLPMKQLRT